MQTRTIRPGLLVSLKTSIRGNVRYETRDVEAQHLTPAGEERATWETTRNIEDPDEHKQAVVVRGKARSMITAVCSNSSFGQLCPESRAMQLSEAIEDAQQMIAEFNRTSRLSRVALYVIAGRIAPDDVEAVRAINSEMRDLLADMERGLKNLDVEAVRNAANKAKQVGEMLSPDAQERIKDAIATARSAARRIVKAGEAASLEIDTAVLRKLTTARTAFLDVGEDDIEISSPTETGRAIDLPPMVEVEPRQSLSAAGVMPAFELE